MFSNPKRLIAIAALLLAIPVVANAQTSRVEGMAIQGDYIKDYTGIYQYPSQVTNVGNLIYGEFGNSDFPNGSYDRGVGSVLNNLFDGRFGTWAIHLKENTPNLGSGDVASHAHPGVAGFDPNNHSNQAFDIMWGKKFGTSSFGLRLNRSYYNDETEVPGVTTTLKFDVPTAGDPNLARNIMGLGAGMTFEMNPQSSLDVSILFESRTFENGVATGTPATTTRDENDGGGSYIIAARMMRQWTSNVVLTPVFKWYNYDLSRKTLAAGGATTNFDNSLKGWQLGAAGNWTLGSNDLFVMGLTFASNKIDQQQDLFGITGGTVSDSATVSETLMPQLFAALETHVNSWLTIRFGANQGVFQSVKLEETGVGSDGVKSSETVSFSDFDMMLGAGVKVGTLQFDAIVADNFYQNLGYLGSGNPQGGGYWPKVTATYSF